MALEEQKANLTRELNSVKHTHNKVRHHLSLCARFSFCFLVTLHFYFLKYIFLILSFKIQLVQLTHRDLLEKKKEWESEASTFR